ncbi:MAG: hypothetical protein WC205_16550 [Opitutaceae bacterium]
MLAIEVAKSAQPLIEGADTDPDAPDEDGGAEVQPHIPSVEVAAIAAATATTGATGAPNFDEEGPVWPDEAAESAMRAEVVDRGETLSSKAAREAAEAAAEAEAEKRNLPKLDELIGRIPTDVRDTLEELFRAKFVKVARTPKKALKG